MNPAWRFHKGHVNGAEAVQYNDEHWSVVSLPHGIDTLPAEASGCVNYQGEVWYRKHFKPMKEWEGKRLQLHFEAIMGKCKVWVNGKLLTEHLGGFLPVIIDLTNRLNFNSDNVITVCADNSDDPSYPPGKAQDVLDFTYAGGIYRDCWMIVTNKIFITDPNEENDVAGGGLFVSYSNLSESVANLQLDLQVKNKTNNRFQGKVLFELVDDLGKVQLRAEQNLSVDSQSKSSITATKPILKPHLWSPDDPYLYKLRVYVKDRAGNTVDGYYQRIGIRSIEFRGKDGFWLNGKPYMEPLIGANRHQDFAVIGNALPNSLHWRDAKKLRDAGLRVIRNAHYPQDPAFMDACDEMGLFVIVNTPGWQFWNEEPGFAQGVYSDIRNMVRRDRNHASVWLWEPILNETWYPEDFAKQVKSIVHEEYPYPYCYVACDANARGAENYVVQFSHPLGGDPQYSQKELKPNVTYFTREWGDNVDDWSSHNSPSRVSRAWGEIPMLIQAQGYAKPNYEYTCYDSFYHTTRQHVGGCLWHSFDHQRGYHPDPFYGGIMDNYRQPKYSYYLFCAQRPVEYNKTLISESGPMVYIANAMTPFSPSDVTVYSNCPEVRLTYCKEGKQYVYQQSAQQVGMPHPIILFHDVFHVMDDKELSRLGHQEDSYLLAEGICDGKVVATHKVMPSRRPTKLKLWVDDENVRMEADGSDMVTVIAAIIDDKGTIKRLNNQQILFSIEGQGRLVADEKSFTNPKQIQWGTAPVLVQATTIPGVIKVKASVVWEGKATPIESELIINTSEASQPLIYDIEELSKQVTPVAFIKNQGNAFEPLSEERLKEVEKQQIEFENVKVK